MVIAPRYLERAERVAQLAREAGLHVGLRSSGNPERAPVVDRTAERVEDTPQQVVADAQPEGVPGRVDAVLGADSVHLAERHQQRASVAEADDLGGDRWAGAPGVDRAQLAHLGAQPGRLDDEADQVDDLATTLVEVGRLQCCEPLGQQRVRHRAPAGAPP